MQFPLAVIRKVVCTCALNVDFLFLVFYNYALYLNVITHVNICIYPDCGMDVLDTLTSVGSLAHKPRFIGPQGLLEQP